MLLTFVMRLDLMRKSRGVWQIDIPKRVSLFVRLFFCQKIKGDKDMNEEKQYYLNINGEKVVVSEEVYRVYIRPVRAAERARHRNKKCLVVGEKGNLVRCTKNCQECEYAFAKKPTGGLSLESLMDNNMYFPDTRINIEEEYIRREEEQEMKAKLHKAIKMLNSRQQEIVKLYFWQGKTQEEIAEIYGIDRTSIAHAMRRILRKLKEFLKNEKYF